VYFERHELKKIETILEKEKRVILGFCPKIMINRNLTKGYFWLFVALILCANGGITF
jgi:hypothetical protein